MSEGYDPLALLNLKEHRVPCDEEGVIVQVSRQALDETIAFIERMARLPDPEIALAEKDAVIGRLREANGILEDALQEAGDDYPGSSMQEWCVQQIARARQSLADLDGAR